MSAFVKKHNFDSVFDCQKVFRLLLEAMANPGREVSIRDILGQLSGENREMLALGMTLLDNEVSFSIDGQDTLAEEIHSLTLAEQVQPEEADFIFGCSSQNLRALTAKAKCGSLADPHKSALLIIQAAGPKTCGIVMRGPGINESIRIQTSEIVREALVLRDQQFYEYPQGIDLVLLTEDGMFMAIPRLVRWEVEEWHM